MRNKLFFIVLLFCEIAHSQTVPWTGGDDYAGIQAALNAGGIVNFDGTKIYQSSQPLIVPSNTIVNGNGAHLQPTSALPVGKFNQFMTTESKVIYTATTSAIAVVAGSNTFSYSGAGSLVVGSLLLVQGPVWTTYSSGTFYHGWFSKVTAINGTTVTMEHTAATTFQSTSIEQYKTTVNVHIKNLFFDMQLRDDGVGVSLQNAVKSSIENCTVTGKQYTGLTIGIWLKDCVQSKVFSCSVQKGETQVVTAFGIDMTGQQDTIQSCNVNGYHQPIISPGNSYRSRALVMSSNTISNTLGGSGSALDFHGNSEGFIAYNTVNYVNPDAVPIHAIHIRCINTTVDHNVVTIATTTGVTVYGVYGFENMTSNATVSNNKFYFTGTAGSGRAFMNSSGIPSPTMKLRITGNLIENGTLIFNGKIGDGFQCDRNRLVQKTATYPCINVATKYIAMGSSISDNVFINTTGNTFNYSINTSDSLAGNWNILRDTIYHMNVDNLFPPVRLNNITNTVQSCVLYSPYNYFIRDYSGLSGNVITGNNIINSSGTPTPFEPGSPAPGDEVTPPPVDEPAPVPDDSKPNLVKSHKKIRT